LSEEAGPALRLPLVGDLNRLSRRARVTLAGGVGLLIALIITGLMALVDAVL
jgi:hypothetical protein